MPDLRDNTLLGILIAMTYTDALVQMGFPYQIKITRSRSIRLAIKDGILIISTPRFALHSLADIIKSKQQWIESHMTSSADAYKQADQLIAGRSIPNLKKEAKQIIVQRVDYWSHVMSVAPTKVRLSSAKTRWGSCSGKNAVSINWRLTLLDRHILDYVVIHELAHITHKNHSKQFWSLVERFCTDYTAKRKLLKRYGFVMSIGLG